jgi:hypothetical protein
MMLSALLLGSAFAVCSLPADIDPNGACVEDNDNGYSTLDADSDVDIPISLVVAIKGSHVDAFSVTHGATVGTLNPLTDSRYILDCPQAAGKKTVKLTVTRPASYTAFGAEWVQMFPKDSWSNVTNEYEPFAFNDYGAKIPLAEFRPTSTGLADDAPLEGTLNVFMEVSGEGDYEFKYGNPGLISGGYWVAVEFKSTLLRVGTPWADCSGSSLDSASYTVGSIMPVLFGGPNLNSIALASGFASYDAAIADLAGTTVDVKVVLEIFNAVKTTYTSSANDGQCYKAGNACPENHAVCSPDYCEMDVWADIIADFKLASSSVSVLGSVGTGTTYTQYSDLTLDGFYFVDQTVPAGYTGYSVVALGSPLFDDTTVADADVYVTLASSDIGIWNPFSWYPSVTPSKWAAIVTDKADASDVATLVDRGYGYVYVTSETDFTTQSTITSTLLSAITGVSGGRRLEGRSLTASASASYWGCDDTLMECKPVCLKQTGVVTTKVSDKHCAGAQQPDECSCKCLHDAEWSCDGDSVVCKAKHGAGELQIVGDKVCETRGADKPASVAELRVASKCEPMTEMRGSAPTEECLAQWGTPAPKETPTESEEDAAIKDAGALLDASFAAPFALAAALALYA